ncbi:MAG TPA: hypothetical protein VKB38_13925 [Terracidiphilus sp.]|nr:hypothetical protein [Terracidiphilus sp.]
MTAIESALRGLIDYAGLYPPAALDMRAAVRNYLGYGGQKSSAVLGRFIVDIARLDELREATGDGSTWMRLSVIASPDTDPELIARHRDDGLRIESVEIRCDAPLTIARITEALPPTLEQYFEIPVQALCSEAVDALGSVGARAKLRMGGVVAEAFPAMENVVRALQLLADRRVPFKATAGLHHPVRSRHPLTYAADSPCGMMHGFMNLLCAAAVIRFGGAAREAVDVLEEQDPAAFRVTDEEIVVRGHVWNVDQLREVRQFFISFGSCSFTEPIHDLEAMGWPLE